jgi:hypothetical protein
MKRAHIADIDAALDAAVTRCTQLCERMTEMTFDERVATVPALTALAGEIAELQFKRAERIRETFYRGGAR